MTHIAKKYCEGAGSNVHDNIKLCAGNSPFALHFLFFNLLQNLSSYKYCISLFYGKCVEIITYFPQQKLSVVGVDYSGFRNQKKVQRDY